MKPLPLLAALTIVNTALVSLQLLSNVSAAAPSAADAVLRGRALEIVDDQGRVRASIKVQPAETFAPTGRKHPETVMLRLVDPNGRPEVKIGASIEGGGISLVGDNDATQVLVHAERAESSIKLANRDGRQQLLKP